MPFNTKFTPSQYQDRDQYNENVLNERYVTVKALRESYSHIYQELANLRNNLQDYKSEQDNQPELSTAESDRIRYNNEIENRYLALKSIQLNTSYPNEYGHTIRPFSENKAAEQLRLHCHYMISGSHHFKQYHLAKTSCLELNQDTSGETIKEYNSNVVNMKSGNLHVNDLQLGTVAGTIDAEVYNRTGAFLNAITPAGVFTTVNAHGLTLGDQLFCYSANCATNGDLIYVNKSFFVNSIPSTTTYTLSEELGGTTVTNTAATGANQLFSFWKKGDTTTVTLTMSHDHSLNVGDKITLSGFKNTAAHNFADIFNGEEVTTITSTATSVVKFTFDCFGLKTAITIANITYEYVTNGGEINVPYEIKFPYKKFYLNKLDASNSSAIYGNDSSSRTFTYSDNYIESGLDTVEGHVYMITRANVGTNAELDGRQTASVLGRNVKNLENMIEIVANNCNATEQAMNRIVQIAELTGVEINHN